MTNYSTPIVVRVIKIETMRFHYILAKLSKMIRLINDNCWQGCEKNQNSRILGM